MFKCTHLASVLVSGILIASAATLASPSALMAAAESDIPGIPLPGPVATGLLGGPIYDVVYRLDVQPGYVIVAGVTGPSGTDFDLYLFDATATTVVSNQGLLAKSTGPTSSENLSYPSFTGGTYYIDLNGATNVEGTYTLTVQLVKDSDVPTASLLLGNGRPATNSTTVDVYLTAGSALSGISQMAFSDDGVLFTPWQAYTAATSWAFAPGDGVKTLWAKVKNGVGTESPPTAASIELDTVPPSVDSIAPTPNAATIGLRPAFTVGFDEAMDAPSWIAHGLVVQAANGLQIAGVYTYDSRLHAGSFVPDADLVPGVPYVVTVGLVRDMAGNVVGALDSWLVTPLLPTSLSLSASRTIVLPATQVTLGIDASGLEGQPVILERRQGRETVFSRDQSITVSSGHAATTVTPRLNTTFRVSFAGSSISAGATSPEVRVLVRRRVELTGVSPLLTRTVHQGSAVRLTAEVTPSGGGARLSFRRYRYDPLKRTYVYSGSFGRTTDPDGRASLTWTPTAGKWYWRVAVLPSPEFANNVSGIYRWTIAPR